MQIANIEEWSNKYTELCTLIKTVPKSITSNPPSGTCQHTKGEYGDCSCGIPTYVSNPEYNKVRSRFKILADLYHFCQCGASVDPKKRFCGDCGLPSNVRIPFHKQCKNWKPWRTFCPDCGQASFPVLYDFSK